MANKRVLDPCCGRDVREKLVELLVTADDYENSVCRGYPCKVCQYKGTDCTYKAQADYLIAHGVTVQELDGCEYCKEDSEGFRRMFGAFSLVNPFHGKTWQIHAGKCKPREINFCPMCGRRLPQPPKRE